MLLLLSPEWSKSNKSICTNSKKTNENDDLHLLLVISYEGGLFFYSGDLCFVGWNSFYCLSPFFFLPDFLRHECTWTVLTSSCFVLRLETYVKPTSKTTWRACRELGQLKCKPVAETYLGGAQKGENLTLCVLHEAHFFPSTLILFGTFQLSFEIGLDTSIQSMRNSMPLTVVLS